MKKYIWYLIMIILLSLWFWNTFANDDVDLNNIFNNFKLKTNKVINTSNLIMKWQSENNNELKQKLVERKEYIKNTFDTLGNKWKNSVSPFISKDGVATTVYKSVWELNPNLITKWSFWHQVIKMEKGDATSNIIKKFLIDPFKNSKWKLDKNVYKEEPDGLKTYTYKTYIDRNTHMNMWVVSPRNVELQKIVFNRMCDRMVCIKNDNWDLLVYPSLTQKQLNAFSFLNCSYNEETKQFKNCNINNTNDNQWWFNPSPVITKKNSWWIKYKPIQPWWNDKICIVWNKCDDNGDKKITISNLKDTWWQQSQNVPANCWNWQLDLPQEQCEIWVDWWTADTCTSECTIKNRETIHQNRNNKKTELKKIKTLPSCYNIWNVYNGKKITDVKYVINHITIDSWDNYIGTWYYIYYLSWWDIVKVWLSIKWNINYYKIWDYWKYDNNSMYFGDWIDWFKYNPESDIFNLNIDNVSRIKVYPDVDKFTKYENFKKYLIENFVWYNGNPITTNNANNYIIKNEIYGFWKTLTTPLYDSNTNTCNIQENIRKINIYKINGEIKSKNWAFLNKDIHLDNVFAIDRLILQNNNVNNVIAPYLHYIYQKLLINNFTVKNTLYTPTLHWLAIKQNDMLLNSNFLQLNKNNFWTFIKQSNINDWKTDLEVVVKNFYIKNSKINSFNNNNHKIKFIMLWWKNPSVILKYNSNSDPTISWDWNWVLTLVWDNSISPSFTNSIQLLWNLVLKWVNNTTIPFENLNHLIDWIYLRESNKNTLLMPNTTALNVVKMNNNTDMCSDDYIKWFRAFNNSVIDTINSSDNEIRLWRLRHIWFDKYRNIWYLLWITEKIISPTINKILITSSWNSASLWNKIYVSLKPICKNWLWLYKYNDWLVANDLWYNEHNLSAIKIVELMQKHMFKKPTDWGLWHYIHSISTNKKHIEFITTLKWNKEDAFRLFFWLKSWTHNTLPFLWDHNEKWTIITLWEPVIQWDDFSYIAHTPTKIYNWWWGGWWCWWREALDNVCVWNDLHYNRWQYKDWTTCELTWSISERIQKNSWTCMYSQSYCNLANWNYSWTWWIEDWVSKWTDYFRDEAKTILFSSSVDPEWCLGYKQHCNKDDKIWEWYKYNWWWDLYKSKLYVNWCLAPSSPPPTITSAPPQRQTEVITSDWATDLIINKNAPIISVWDNDYWLSDQLWLSYIDSSNNRNVKSEFAFKWLFYYSWNTLNDWTDIYVQDKNWNKYDVWYYTTDIGWKSWIVVWDDDTNPNNVNPWTLILYDVYWYDTNHNIWTYGLAYKIFCETQTQWQCHFNHNDYSYFTVWNNHYVLWIFIDPNKTIELTKWDWTVVNAPVRREYKLFKYDNSNGFWYEIWNIWNTLNWNTLKVNWVTVNNTNSQVYIYYTDNDWTKKQIILWWL